MTPAELQQLLITRAPDMPHHRRRQARQREPYELTVTLEGGGRAWWTINGASPAGPRPDSGAAWAAVPGVQRVVGIRQTEP